MNKQTVLRTALSLLLIAVLMIAGVVGVNAFTAPIVAENERLAAEAAAEKPSAIRKQTNTVPMKITGICQEITLRQSR